MTTPYALDYGTLFAEEIRLFRKDSDRSIRASRIRKYIRLGFYNIRNSVTQMTMLAVVGLPLITQAYV